MTTPGYFELDAPLAFAHRGGAGVPANVGIENTIAAFRHAHDLGYRWFETDVRLSADGVVMVFHDETLERVVGENVGLAELTAAELHEKRVGGREPIPTLAELLEEFGDVKLNIDVKSDDVVEATLDLLAQTGRFEDVCIASFNHRRLRRIRQLAPAAMTSASSWEAARVVLGAPVPRSPLVYQVPVERKGVPVVNKRFLARAHGRGAQVHVWTIDEPAQMHHLLDLGVDGIMTDRTDLLRDVLIERGQWKELP